jgi:hypothetical protein
VEQWNDIREIDEELEISKTSAARPVASGRAAGHCRVSNSARGVTFSSLAVRKRLAASDHAHNRRLVSIVTPGASR